MMYGYAVTGSGKFHVDVTRSADYAENVLKKIIESTLPSRVSELIRYRPKVMSVKRSDIINELNDLRYFHDILCAQLGSSAEEYDASVSCKNRETEYVFGDKARGVVMHTLESFLERDCVFLTDHFRDSLEQQARENLTRRLEDLKSQTR